MEWSQSLTITESKKEEAKHLLNKFSRAICKQVRKKIWNDRCIKLQDSGMKPKTHRQVERNGNGIRKRKKKKSKGKEKEEETNTNSEILQDNSTEESTLRQVQNKLSIWEWIKEGKKWLGL